MARNLPEKKDSNNVHFKPSSTVFSYQQQRVLFLDGDNGSVACRVHGAHTSSTLPHRSEAGNIELATRSLLRMKNLSAVRGVPGSSMVGPADYYGNLERPHETFYTINVLNGLPQIVKQDQGPIKEIEFLPINSEHITIVTAKWTSGTGAIKSLVDHYSQQGPAFGKSLFPNPGILEIDGDCDVHLKSFDATKTDLSSFKARLVANNSPFRITEKALPASDEYRAVSFLYEPGYGKAQVAQGGGLFLETHSFAQTMTPLDKHAQGFVVLGRWEDNSKTKLALISIKIPYGYTLIVEENCIHGDATLDGMYMMCMTTNHLTMQTADSVFLKNTDTLKNINLIFDEETKEPRPLPTAPRPHVLYKGYSSKDMIAFLKETKNKSFIFNPFSSGFWHRGYGLMMNSNMELSLLGGIIATAGLATVILSFGVLNAATFGVVGVCVAAMGTVLALVGLGIFSSALPAQGKLSADLDFNTHQSAI